MVRDYVVRFLVKDLPERVEEALLEDGRFVVWRRCGLTVIEAEDSAVTAVEAGVKLAEALRSLEVCIREALPELVTMADIHRRVGVSKQAVSKWVNHPSADAFPVPYAFTDGSPLWQWQLVNEWVRTRGHGHDAWDVPTVAEIHAINEKLNTPVRTPGEDRVPA
ncbi:MAG: hypothetical protein Q4D89_04405 [Arachnia propionica]|uniref:helix-turn-helix transcriptional regulator n=1 Tax=Arachnia propionica TaxID=1750 RepID=UPI002709BD2A|nr:hypothetical protein [Arachnia propionica]